MLACVPQQRTPFLFFFHVTPCVIIVGPLCGPALAGVEVLRFMHHATCKKLGFYLTLFRQFLAWLSTTLYLLLHVQHEQPFRGLEPLFLSSPSFVLHLLHLVSHCQAIASNSVEQDTLVVLVVFVLGIHECIRPVVVDGLRLSDTRSCCVHTYVPAYRVLWCGVSTKLANYCLLAWVQTPYTYLRCTHDFGDKPLGICLE